MQPNQSLVERQLNQIQTDQSEMRIGLQQIAEAITRLAVVEERHKAVEASIHRIEDRVEKIDERQRANELTRDAVIQMNARLRAVEMKSEINQLDHVKATATIAGVTSAMKVMWTAFGGGVGYLVVQLIQLIRHSGF